MVHVAPGRQLELVRVWEDREGVGVGEERLQTAEKRELARAEADTLEHRELQARERPRRDDAHRDAQRASTVVSGGGQTLALEDVVKVGERGARVGEREARAVEACPPTRPYNRFALSFLCKYGTFQASDSGTVSRESSNASSSTCLQYGSPEPSVPLWPDIPGPHPTLQHHTYRILDRIPRVD